MFAILKDKFKSKRFLCAFVKSKNNCFFGDVNEISNVDAVLNTFLVFKNGKVFGSLNGSDEGAL